MANVLCSAWPCEITWLKPLQFNKAFVLYLKSFNSHRCISYNENFKGIRMDPNDELDNPCLGYNDADKKTNCAFCKIGMARIFAVYQDSEGNI